MTPDKRKRLLNRELARIVSKIKRDYSPIKIILFGSLAAGDVHEWSDIDLVIIKTTSRTFLDRIEDVLLVRPKVGCDVIVYTPEEFEGMKKEGNYFIKDEINKAGRILYERDE